MPNQRFLKKNILSKKQEFKDVFEKGRKLRADYFSAYIYCHKLLSDSKIGIIISKKVKKAVKRNKYKRMIREYYRINKSRFKQKNHLIIMVFKDIVPDRYCKVEGDLNNIFNANNIH